MTAGSLKCHRCAVCNGYGCPGNLPGLGGVFENKNFQLNCDAWTELQKGHPEILDIEFSPSDLRCGPVTGAVENIGYANEEDFYFPYLKTAYDLGYGLCVGDGCPDLKLQLGVAAVKKLRDVYQNGTAVNDREVVDNQCETAVNGRKAVVNQCETAVNSHTENCRNDASVKAAFFLKPYPDEKLDERLTWIKPYAEYIGIDIDSYNILTMRNLVNLERKTAAQLQVFRSKFEVPFVIKGVFTEADVELVRQVRPDVVYISNHGGRVETRIGSTAEFLRDNADELKKYCDQIWVDGGIRSKADVQTALFYGADKVIMARPLIRAVFDEEKFRLE